MAARLSLAEQIAQLEDAAPVDFDPEDARNADIEGGMVIDSVAGREHYFEVGPSSLRKLHDSISDPKYDGVKTSRKRLEAESDPPSESEEASEEDEDQVDDEAHGHLDAEGLGDDTFVDDSSDEHTQSESDEEEEALPRTPPTASVDDQEDMAATLQKTREADRKKGKAVSRQIATWDALLDARIQLQKAVTATNRLPTPSALADYQTEECTKPLTEMLEEALLLSEELFELEDKLLNLNDVITPPPRKRRKVGGSDTIEDLSSQLKDATTAAAELEHQYVMPYLHEVLQYSFVIFKITPTFTANPRKMVRQSQAVAPSVLLPSTRNAFTKNNQHLKSVVQLIEENLVDQGKLLSRTRLKRGKGTRIGTVLKEEENNTQQDAGVEIFDDTDFYQQLLRDIIDSRGENNIMSDWVTAQREKKAKKKVDTKASKGRKIRYVVKRLRDIKLADEIGQVSSPREDAKLHGANSNNAGWHEEQIDELFASLLDKGYGGHVEDGEIEQKEMEGKTKDALKSGFRVFG